jgi:putative transposase
VLVDTLGLIWGLAVLPADIQDRDGGRTLLEKVQRLLPRLEVVWADGAYTSLVAWAQQTFDWILMTVLRPVGVRGYIHLPHRWIVERTFGWLGRYRRLSKDYETFPRNSETWIYIAASHRMARGLVPDRKNRDDYMRRRRQRKRRF